MYPIRCLAGGALACLIAVGAHAAEDRGDNGAPGGYLAGDLPQPLRLDEALRWAQHYNFDLRTAQAVLGERVGQALHAARPVPSNPHVEVGAGRRDGPDRTSTDIGIRVSQELWIGGQGGLQERAAQARTESAQGQLAFLRTAVAARTRRAFLGLLAAKEAVRTAQQVREIASDVQRFARRRLQAGQATQLEVNTAAIGVGRARAALARATRDATRARLALTELLAIDPARTLKIEGELSPEPLDIPDLEALLNRSLQRREDLAAAGLQVMAASEEVTLARRQLIPNLTVFGFYEQEESDEIPGIGVSLSLPTLHRFAGERQQASARLRQTRIERDALMLSVRREVLQAVADYRAARDQVSVLTEETLNAAEQNVELTQRAFRAGEVGSPAIASAQDNLFSVRQVYLDALNNLIAAGTALERTTGGLLVMSQAASKRSQ